MKFRMITACLIVSSIFFNGCKSDDKKENDIKPVETKTPKLKEEEVVYTIDSLKMHSFIVYDENVQGKRRARMLAELGYTAMAVDMYGNGRMGNDPQQAQALAMPFYMHPDMAKKHFDAALEQLKKNSSVDTMQIGAMGYCFGGAVVIGA